MMIHLGDAVVQLERRRAVDETPASAEQPPAHTHQRQHQYRDQASQSAFTSSRVSNAVEAAHHAKLGSVFSTVFPRPPLWACARRGAE